MKAHSTRGRARAESLRGDELTEKGGEGGLSKAFSEAGQSFYAQRRAAGPVKRRRNGGGATPGAEGRSGAPRRPAKSSRRLRDSRRGESI